MILAISIYISGRIILLNTQHKEYVLVIKKEITTFVSKFLWHRDAT